MTPGQFLPSWAVLAFEALAAVAMAGVPVGAWSLWREERTAAGAALGAVIGLLGTPALAAALAYAMAVAYFLLP